ncbi:MAG TPA: zinc-dependent alcohol dehydrogenase family protein [Vicinamibacterales bacterium]
MALTRAGSGRVESVTRDTPVPGPGQLLIRVHACGVCRTDLHVVDGDLPDPAIPVVPGHEIVGTVEAIGEGVSGFAPGDRIGVPWLGWSCGECEWCRSGQENLCPAARYTGYQIDGGYADCTIADARFCFALPDGYDDLHAAPLLCAGLIGYRAYRLAGAARPGSGGGRRMRLGLYGFGAAAHIIAQVAAHDDHLVYAFVRPGDEKAADFALSLGARWAGPSNEPPPEPLDAAIIFAPVGSLVPEALARTRPAGTVVCAGIHMSDIPAFPYALLWQERVVRSVANLTRRDAREFLAVAARTPVVTHPRPYPLEDANRALDDLREGRFTGAAVLVP